MPRNVTNLHNAQSAKKDEFYTQLTDIEKELRYYKSHFENKVVFCNCDDPYESNFFKYFAMNFNQLRLKKLIAVCYDGSPFAGSELALDFGDEIEQPTQPKRTAYKIEITEVVDENGDGAIDLADVEYLMKNDKNVLTQLKGNGDFRSAESIELLQQADIVCTNPPFSLFREYLAQLVQYNKKFLIIGNQNAITFKEVFPLIKSDKLWLGLTMNSSNRWFQVPDYYEKYHKIENGKKYAFVAGVVWWTNLEHDRRSKDKIELYKIYTPEEFPKYDNYDAINVDDVKNIPEDYYGVMGVPISFLHKYNPEQFEIVALGNSRDNFTPNKDYINPQKVLKDGKKVAGGAINCVLAISVQTKPIGEIYYTSDNSNYLIAPYARILIRRRRHEYDLGTESVQLAAEPK